MKNYTILEALNEMQNVMGIDISRLLSIAYKTPFKPYIFIIENTSGWKGEINLDEFTAIDAAGNLMEL